MLANPGGVHWHMLHRHQCPGPHLGEREWQPAISALNLPSSLIRLRRMMLPGRDRCHGEKIMDRGSVYRRCGCRDKATGKLLGAGCPGLRSPEHGSWCFSADLPSAAGDRRRVRRGGFPTREAASAALEALASPAAGPEPGLSTGEWLSRWLASRVSLRASTSRSYAAHMRG